ncbi:MAG: hypothetical protein ACLSAF_00265 [Intestinimonas sp.]
MAEHLPGGLRAYAYGLYMTQVKRKKTVVHQMVLERAQKLGPEACTECMYRESSAARRALEEQGEVNHYPPCTFPKETGLVVPDCRQTLDRILAAIPRDELTLARRGRKALKDDCMPMAIRAKPEQVNEVWFGDHHQMDCFVLDEEGKAVRPWLTMWYDAASGFPVGWVLCKKPNTQTIIAAFNNAVLVQEGQPKPRAAADGVCGQRQGLPGEAVRDGVPDGGEPGAAERVHRHVLSAAAAAHRGDPRAALPGLVEAGGAVFRDHREPVHPGGPRLVRGQPGGAAGGLQPPAAADDGAGASCGQWTSCSSTCGTYGVPRRTGAGPTRGTAGGDRWSCMSLPPGAEDEPSAELLWGAEEQEADPEDRPAGRPAEQ